MTAPKCGVSERGGPMAIHRELIRLSAIQTQYELVKYAPKKSKDWAANMRDVCDARAEKLKEIRDLAQLYLYDARAERRRARIRAEKEI